MRSRAAALCACALVIGTVGVLNHDRARRSSAAAVSPTPSAPGTSASALGCAIQISEPDTALLSVAEVWPGSGGGGDSTTAVDLGGCATPAATSSAGSTCRLDPFTQLSDSAERYLAALGARTAVSRQLVHGPAAAVTETVVTFASSAAGGAMQLSEMVSRCGPAAAAGLRLATATVSAPAASRSVVVLEFDDGSLTSTLRAKLLAGAVHALAAS